ncbi:hypothetical protein J2S59_000307 [Nocardioides massiliensis]|uniref:Uncharacterized protein n=1 Tax=Nocardioides massiliensis TaxID=1325935 RepID=A0ABT9NJA4_9ACTN|nr:hypothetical protein [Nocardioides massiliensis]
MTELLGRVFRTHHGWVFEDGSTTKAEPLGLRPLDMGVAA